MVNGDEKGGWRAWAGRLLCFLGVRAWLKGAPPARIGLAALKGFILVLGLALVLIVVFLRY